MCRPLLLSLCGFWLASAGVQAQTSSKNFHDQDLKGRDFSQATLNGADFSDAILRDCKFTGASLKHANFHGADLTDAWLVQADLTEADLQDVKGSFVCNDSHFDRANLEKIVLRANTSTFKGANLRESKIMGYVWRCDFSGADLRGANLRGMTQPTDASANRWKGALYDDDTAWPDGFDPVAAGAVLSKVPAK